MGAVSSPPKSVSSSPPREESSQEVSNKKRRYSLAFVGEMIESAEALEIERQQREVQRQERADGVVGRKKIIYKHYQLNIYCIRFFFTCTCK